MTQTEAPEPGRSASASARSALRRTPGWLLVAVGVLVAVLAIFLLLRVWSTEDVRITGLAEDHAVRSSELGDGGISVQTAASGLHVQIDRRQVPVSDARDPRAGPPPGRRRGGVGGRV